MPKYKSKILTEKRDKEFGDNVLNASEEDLQNPEFLVEIAKALGGRLSEEYEKIIGTKCYPSFRYANEIIKGKFPLGEIALFANRNWDYRYRTIVLGETDVPMPESMQFITKRYKYSSNNDKKYVFSKFFK